MGGNVQRPGGAGGQEPKSEAMAGAWAHSSPLTCNHRSVPRRIGISHVQQPKRDGIPALVKRCACARLLGVPWWRFSHLGDLSVLLQALVTWPPMAPNLIPVSERRKLLVLPSLKPTKKTSNKQNHGKWVDRASWLRLLGLDLMSADFVVSLYCHCYLC